MGQSRRAPPQKGGNVRHLLKSTRLYCPTLGLEPDLVDHFVQSFNEHRPTRSFDLSRDLEATRADLRGELSDQVIRIDLVCCMSSWVRCIL